MTSLRTAHAELKRTDADPTYRSRFEARGEEMPLPSAMIPRLVRPPTVDGQLNDAVWADATELSPFLRSHYEGQDRTPEAATRVKLGYDDNAIYVAIECIEDRMADIKAVITERDGEVYVDDCIELFLDTNAAGATYFHFAVNALGTQFDERKSQVEWGGADPTWDGEWQAAAHRAKDRWTVEIAVPFATLGMEHPSEGQTWRANVARERHVVNEFSTWSGLRGRFHQPLQFGKLRYASATSVGDWVVFFAWTASTRSCRKGLTHVR